MLTALDKTFPDPLQFGFVPEHGAIPALYTLKECINVFMKSKSKLYVGFLDNEKAFDKIWHDGLFLKLKEIGVTGKLWNILFMSYKSASAHVQYNGLTSDNFSISQGHCTLAKVWGQLSNSEIELLERTQRYVARYIQCMDKYSPTDSTTSNLGLWSLEAVIDKFKLLFFGRLYELPIQKSVDIFNLDDDDLLEVLLGELCTVVNTQGQATSVNTKSKEQAQYSKVNTHQGQINSETLTVLYPAVQQLYSEHTPSGFRISVNTSREQLYSSEIHTEDRQICKRKQSLEQLNILNTHYKYLKRKHLTEREMLNTHKIVEATSHSKICKHFQSREQLTFLNTIRTVKNI
ncbi:unnamed protein product [Mytilus edulis]|uniref:Reverse transcriptase domain-containing protein n=1 Tax=Mytilus edulis TaxID=6550 RepID=A0A8S3ULW2_MYTED|nr:unnamed protein product [Mytilus edulis]